jgi:predicted nucleic-acid-binding Zn-ribbon protein
MLAMIIWGFRGRNKVMGQLQFSCTRCKNVSFHGIVRTTRWFTLFFIPLIPFNKYTTARCNMCGFQTKMDNQQADAMIASSQVQAQVR